MYTHAAATNKWFGEVRLIVWGPSARLLAADKDLQAKPNFFFSWARFLA
jgi:hypothetical protein